MLSHQELEAREAGLLAPYAQRSLDSRGRHYEEIEEGCRTRYQRDRDRIIHSRAFRRLEYKTQVFLNGTGDHLRTRLTHTMEVAAISRNISRALGINEDLTEAISLAHDLGHSPFGHNGEETLNELMQEIGGFEHNRQSLRIVELLEQKYPQFPGLNLSWEVREGLAKHETTFDRPDATDDFKFLSPSLEAQVSNLADEITYYSHDLDDGLESGLLKESELIDKVEIWAHAAAEVSTHYPAANAEARRYFIIRCIIDREVKDVVETTESHLKNLRPNSSDDVRKVDHPLVNYSPELGKLNRQLRDYLYRNLYYHPEVHVPNLHAVELLKKLFETFRESPQLLPQAAREHSDKCGLLRGIGDFLAGMTDRSVVTLSDKLGIKD